MQGTKMDEIITIDTAGRVWINKEGEGPRPVIYALRRHAHNLTTWRIRTPDQSGYMGGVGGSDGVILDIHGIGRVKLGESRYIEKHFSPSGNEAWEHKGNTLIGEGKPWHY
jgi:hypothetical protein